MTKKQEKIAKAVRDDMKMHGTPAHTYMAMNAALKLDPEVSEALTTEILLNFEQRLVEIEHELWDS